ncbi:hypothetical protein J4229_02955 [Candidatus Pacearchaeota archaeon]|nr:hypothetical protein [Candidatus Pacearchaeota archaeon]
MKNTTQEIRGNFNFIVPTIVPSLIQGEDAEALYNEVKETIKNGVWFWYDENSRTMIGSSTFLAARVDSIVRGLNKGIRVATLADLNRPEVMNMIKDNYYSDTPALVLRSLEDSYKPSNSIITDLVPHIVQNTGRLRLPALITGFDVIPSKNKAGYGLDVVPRNDFSAIHDERLLGKYYGEKFSTVDEQGLPNFDKNGSRTWFARNQGISRLGLGTSLNLVSGCDGDGDLANSDVSGRVMLVREAPAQKKII